MSNGPWQPLRNLKDGPDGPARREEGSNLRVPPLRWIRELSAVELHTVRGDSMSPSLCTGDRLLVNRKAYAASGPERGDMVIIHSPGDGGPRLLKRIVALPGEEVHFLDGMLCIDGEHLAEPYLEGLPAAPGLGDRRWRLGVDQYFTLGDNRAHSTDSRQYGPVELASIAGKVWFRCWPLSAWGPVGN